MSEWISVKDRLPKPNKDILLYWPYWSARPMMGHFNDRGVWESPRALSIDREGGVQINKPTHWVSLPKPPKERES